MGYFVFSVVLWNIIAFLLMAVDKRKAKKKKWRLSERSLLLCAFALGGFGVLAGVIVLRHKTRKAKFKALLALALVVNIVILAMAGWLTKVESADALALGAMQSDLYVSVTNGEDVISFRPTQQEAKGGLIYYPGAQIEPEAFAWAAHSIAGEGYAVFIAKMPLNLAIFGQNRADGIIADNPDIEDWYISGFSLGGVAACGWLAGEPRDVDGLILYASYPSKGDDLSQSGYRVLSVSGSNDGLATPQKIEEYKPYLPADTTYYQIPGGNHTGFALYGGNALQSGDNAAGIPKEAQQAVVVEQTLQFMNDAAA